MAKGPAKGNPSNQMNEAGQARIELDDIVRDHHRLEAAETLALIKAGVPALPSCLGFKPLPSYTYTIERRAEDFGLAVVVRWKRKPDSNA